MALHNYLPHIAPKQQLFLYVPGQFRRSGNMADSNFLFLVALNNTPHLFICYVPPPADVRGHGLPQLPAPRNFKQKALSYVAVHHRKSGSRLFKHSPFFLHQKTGASTLCALSPQDVKRSKHIRTTNPF